MAASSSLPDAIVIVPFRPELASAFAELNREWIERFFRIEQSDLDVLTDPQRSIIDRGGQIFFALDGERVAGTVAALRVSDLVFELAKMAVRPTDQGRGLGERLGQAAIHHARRAGARMMFLETNSRLAPAIRLYERLGFVHATPRQRSTYDRADVYMELELTVAPVMRTGMLIRRSQAEVFAAFVDPAITTQFWFTHSSGPLREGITVQWEWRMYGVSVPVMVRALEPSRRIVIEWAGYGGPTTVAWTFEAQPDGSTFVSIEESGFAGTGDELVRQVTDSTGGFTLVLAGAKALIEHGVRLNLIADRFPRSPASNKTS